MLDAATKIAADCRNTASRLEMEASRQFRFIVSIVAVGLILLAIFPWVRAQFERLAFELRIGDNPSAATSVIDTELDKESEQINELTTQLSDTERKLAAVKRDIKQIEQLAKDFVERTYAKLDSRFSIWTIGLETRQDVDHAVAKETTLRQMVDGIEGKIAVGYRGSIASSQIQILRTKDHNLLTWSLARIDGIDPKKNAKLFSLASNDSGILISVGLQVSHKRESPLVLRSTDDGKTWHYVSVVDADGNVIPGRLLGVTSGPDNNFVAVGVRETNDQKEVLVLLSSMEGQHWNRQHIRDATSADVEGTFFKVTEASQIGMIFAVGNTGSGRSSKAAVFSSEDGGRNWKRDEIVSFDGQPLRGWLNTVTTDNGGRIFAAGSRYRGSVIEPHMMIIARDERGLWKPLEHRGIGEVIGTIFGLVVLGDQSVLGVGREGFFHNANVAVVHLSSDKPGEVIRLVDSGDARIRGTFYFSNADPKFGIIAAGDQVFARNLARLPYSFQPEEHRTSVAVKSSVGGVLDILSLRSTGYRSDRVRGMREEGLSLMKRFERNEKIEHELDDRLEEDEVKLEERREAHEGLTNARDTLSQKLTESSALAGAGGIIAQFSILALLIYMVQIVVNRYRFLRAAEGFYRSRGQAMELLAEASEERRNELLKGVSFTELNLVLSPEQVRIGRVGSNPISELGSVVREFVGDRRRR